MNDQTLTGKNEGYTVSGFWFLHFSGNTDETVNAKGIVSS